MECSEKSSQLVKINIRGTGDLYKITANTVSNFRLPVQTVPKEGSVEPRVLIGADNVHLIVTRKLLEERNGVCRSRTALGWTTHGGMRPEEHITLAVRGVVGYDSGLYELVKRSYAVDALGVSLAGRTSPQDERAMSIMKKTTRPLPSGQWETGLLWKEEVTVMPANRQHALKRLEALEKKFSRDPSLAVMYRTQMSHYIKKGYMRELQVDEEKHLGTPRWYLPHFAVQHPNKPGKVRVVFDAASCYGGVCLNDKLLTGPDLLASLLGNILRFREGRVAIAADVREMFLQIRIRKQDQGAQLLLWREDQGKAFQTFILQSMMFGAKCSPSSAQYVRDQIAGAHEQEYPAGSRAVRENFYMDDYLDAADDSDTALELIRQVTEVLKRGGFELANWAASDPALLGEVPEDQRAKKKVKVFGSATGERVLGCIWDTSDDTFVCPLAESDTPVDWWPTKRELLSAVMRHFDPVGFMACWTIQPKILLQDVWRTSVTWDEKVSSEHRDRWQDWIKLAQKAQWKVPRCCVGTQRDSDVTLHMFSDASEAACCTVAYFTFGEVKGLQVAFVAAKCKVAPLRPLSIPRLELQAALMAARLADTIKRECRCNIRRTVYWTDSSTVLCWLRTDPRRYTTFVANRLGELDELTDVQQWRWVPTKENPADIGTRDKEPPNAEKWFEGPAYIRRPEREWPVQRKAMPVAPELEAKSAVILQLSQVEPCLPIITRFSSWNRLVRTTAWVLRFVARCRRDRRKSTGPTLTSAEIRDAEITWCKASQEESFGPEMELIRKGHSLRKGSRLLQLTPFFDDTGVLRMGTRLKNDANAPVPIILDGKHCYTRLLTHDLHVKAGHPSTERTASDLRESFYVLKLRQCIRGVIARCQACRVRRCQPKVPLMGQLPPGRLAARCRPFTHCGLDFFGPMTVTIGRRTEKRYGALFTCLTTRAIHIELAHSLSSDSAIMAIRRMSARRGYPEVMYSDNGTNFHGADNEMAEAIRALHKSETMQNECANHRMSWQYNPPSAPHMGGAWERLVRSVKRALAVALRERAPKEETLLTALAEAEFTINSRPLTHVSVDARDEEPLTPNHFLLGSASGRPRLTLYGSVQEVYLRKQWKLAQQIADMFWRRWTREYLPTLAQRRKWLEPAEPIREGDLVIVVDGALPRNSWPRGRVLEARMAADGQVRMVKIQTSTGVLTRPAVKVAVLPTSSSDEDAASPTQVLP